MHLMNVVLPDLQMLCVNFQKDTSEKQNTKLIEIHMSGDVDRIPVIRCVIQRDRFNETVSISEAPNLLCNSG